MKINIKCKSKRKLKWLWRKKCLRRQTLSKEEIEMNKGKETKNWSRLCRHCEYCFVVMINEAHM